MKDAVLFATALLFGATSASAQQSPEMVSAQDPDAMATVLTNAGYEVELTKDDVGEPMIISELSGYPLTIYFYECDEQTNDDCQSV